MQYSLRILLIAVVEKSSMTDWRKITDEVKNLRSNITMTFPNALFILKITYTSLLLAMIYMPNAVT